MSTVLILLAIFGGFYLLFNSNIQKVQKKRKKKNKKKTTKAAKENTETRPTPTNTALSDTRSGTEMPLENSSIDKQESEDVSNEEDGKSEDGKSEDSEDQEWKRPPILVVKPSARPKEKGFQSRNNKKENIALSKKQRQNLRKKEIEKSIRNENEILQKQRLEKYRKEQEREALKKLMKS